MSKEIEGSGGKGLTLALLGELLHRHNAFYILVDVDALDRPVNYEELHAGLNSRYATREKKGPSKREVRRQLDFLVKKNFLEVVEEKYQIAPRGTQAVSDLTPRQRTGFVKAS